MPDKPALSPMPSLPRSFDAPLGRKIIELHVWAVGEGLRGADAGFDGLVTLDHTGALAPIDYASWKYTDAKDVPEEYVTPRTAGLCLYATVLGYNKETFPDGKQPKS